MVLVMSRPTHANRDLGGVDPCLRELTPPSPALHSFPPWVSPGSSRDHIAQISEFSSVFSSIESNLKLQLLIPLKFHEDQGWRAFLGLTSALIDKPHYRMNFGGSKHWLQCHWENMSSSDSFSSGRNSSASSKAVGVTYSVFSGPWPSARSPLKTFLHLVLGDICPFHTQQFLRRVTPSIHRAGQVWLGSFYREDVTTQTPAGVLLAPRMPTLFPSFQHLLCVFLCCCRILHFSWELIYVALTYCKCKRKFAKDKSHNDKCSARLKQKSS